MSVHCVRLRALALSAVLYLSAVGWSTAVAAASTAEDAGVEVPLELWDRPRNGRMLLGVPAVRRTLGALATDAQARLVIRHPAGGEGAAQAEELRAWLVAHAIGPERIALRADLPARQPLRFDVTSGSAATGVTR